MSGIPPINKSVVLKTTPEELFDAYTDPSRLEKWFATSARIDLRENGAWRYEFGGGLAAEGRVLEAVRPSRFVWSWERSITPDENGVEQVYESDTINTSLFEAVEGGTRFTIEERNHESREMRDMSEGGIDGMIQTLRAFVEEGIGYEGLQSPE